MKKIICVILIVVLLLVSGALFLAYKTNKAVQIAKEYLSDKYEKQMVYSSVRYSWIDPSIYHVTFTSQEIPEIMFEVYVQNDLTILSEKNEDEKYYTSADNYYLQYFNFLMRNHLNKTVLNIWGEDSKFNSLIEMGMYAFKIPSKLNEQMPLLEMVDIVEGYNHYIDINKNFELEQSMQEARCIFSFCEVLEETGYNPSNVFIDYKNESFVIEYSSDLTIERIAELLES